MQSSETSPQPQKLPKAKRIIRGYQQRLVAEGRYETIDRHRLCSDLPKPLISLVHLLKTIWIILRAAVISSAGRYSDDHWAHDSLRIIQNVESVGGKLSASGFHHRACHPGPVVYVANHMSMIDTFIFPLITLSMGRVTYVVKESLLRYPVFGAVMRAVNPIAVGRRNPREDMKTVLTEGQKFIERGFSVIIFPQATRNSRFEVQQFNSLGVKLARRAKVPVVPVALKTDFQSNGKWIKEMGPVDPSKPLMFAFGKPLKVEGNGRNTQRAVVQFIREHLLDWGGEVVG